MAHFENHELRFSVQTTPLSAFHKTMEPEPTFLDLQCPHCSETVSFPEGLQTKVQECPNCLENIIVPDEPDPLAEKVPLPIETPHLLLRRLHHDDWKDLLECFSDEQLFDYVKSGPTNEERIAEWLEKDSFTKLTSPNAWFYLALQHRETEKVIGDVHWHLEDDRSKATLDVYVHQSFQRQGFGTEALKATLRFCLIVLGIRRIVVSCDVRNTGASRMCEKAGMRREGQFLKDSFLNGEWASTFQYAMLAEEFRDP